MNVSARAAALISLWPWAALQWLAGASREWSSDRIEAQASDLEIRLVEGTVLHVRRGWLWTAGLGQDTTRPLSLHVNFDRGGLGAR